MDIKGQKFGRLVVLEKAGVNRSRNILWLCECCCGNKTIVSANHLRSGHTKSCGCLQKEVVRKNLKYKIFGRLRVIKDTGKRNKDKNILWECVCECGNKIETSSHNLLRGDTQSCGCYANERRSETGKLDLIGQRFGRLAVVEELDARKHRSVLWKCVCDCGNEVIVYSSLLTSGNTKSCGCYQKEKASELCSQRHGELSPVWKGGISKDPYCFEFTKDLKDYIKHRDGYKCINPYCDLKCCDLTVHHIDYDKQHCSPENLVSLCRSCNGKANFDREWHTSWYRAVMYNRYGYTN